MERGRGDLTAHHVADIDGVKPVYPSPPPRRIEKGEPRREKGRQEPPPAHAPRDEEQGRDDDTPQIDEYV
jgi:hypothetical protein